MHKRGGWVGEFWGANVPKTAPREFPMGGGSWRGARGGGRVPFALARTRGLSEDLNSLFGVNGIHRAFMLSLVIAFVAFVALVAGGGARLRWRRWRPWRRRRRSTTTKSDGGDDRAQTTPWMSHLGISTKRMPLKLGLPYLIDER